MRARAPYEYLVAGECFRSDTGDDHDVITWVGINRKLASLCTG